MENYYTGTLQIGLKKELPNNYCLFLKNFRNFTNPHNLFFDLDNSSNDFLETESYKKFQFLFQEIYYSEKQKSLLVSEEKIEEGEMVFCGYLLTLKLHSKNYDNEGEKIIHFLRDYIEPEFYNIKYRFLGYDEDGNHYKTPFLGYITNSKIFHQDFFLDNDFYKKLHDSHKYLCDSCQNDSFQCKHWLHCKNAYYAGVESILREIKRGNKNVKKNTRR